MKRSLTILLATVALGSCVAVVTSLAAEDENEPRRGEREARERGDGDGERRGPEGRGPEGRRPPEGRGPAATRLVKKNYEMLSFEIETALISFTTLLNAEIFDSYISSASCEGLFGDKSFATA